MDTTSSVINCGPGPRLEVNTSSTTRPVSKVPVKNNNNSLKSQNPFDIIIDNEQINIESIQNNLIKQSNNIEIPEVPEDELELPEDMGQYGYSNDIEVPINY